VASGLFLLLAIADAAGIEEDFDPADPQESWGWFMVACAGGVIGSAIAIYGLAARSRFAASAGAIGQAVAAGMLFVIVLSRNGPSTTTFIVVLTSVLLLDGSVVWWASRERSA
jgi:hypothetical protein